MYLWLETTFGTVQKWSLRPLLDSPKGGRNIGILLYVSINYDLRWLVVIQVYVLQLVKTGHGGLYKNKTSVIFIFFFFFDNLWFIHWLLVCYLEISHGFAQIKPIFEQNMSLYGVKLPVKPLYNTTTGIQTKVHVNYDKQSLLLFCGLTSMVNIFRGQT